MNGTSSTFFRRLSKHCPFRYFFTRGEINMGGKLLMSRSCIVCYKKLISILLTVQLTCLIIVFCDTPIDASNIRCPVATDSRHRHSVPLLHLPVFRSVFTNTFSPNFKRSDNAKLCQRIDVKDRKKEGSNVPCLTVAWLYRQTAVEALPFLILQLLLLQLNSTPTNKLLVSHFLL